jgi:hypothetical protein
MKERDANLKLSELLDEALEAQPRFASQDELRSCVNAILSRDLMRDDFAVIAETKPFPIIVTVARERGDALVLAIMIRTPGASFKLGDEGMIIGDGPTTVLRAEFNRRLGDGSAKNPLDVIRLAKRISVPSTPTVERGTPEIFAAAHRMLLSEIGRFRDIAGLPESDCSWPLHQWVEIARKDPTAPLLLHANPNHFVFELSANDDPWRTRAATIGEFVRGFEGCGNSAHDKIAAEAMLTETAEFFDGVQALKHPGWARFLPT